ncbi:hypothetical protein ACA910_005821 [Epithemia clementina (nom. ined.)]
MRPRSSDRALLPLGAAALFLCLTSSFAFVPSVTWTHSHSGDLYHLGNVHLGSSFSLLCATKKKGRKEIGPSSSHSPKLGFRSSSKSKKKEKGIGLQVADESDDYATFPRLDPDVEETLIQSPSVLFHEPGILPDEVYERLKYIYGFSNFNRGLSQTTSDDASSASFQDLLKSMDSGSGDIEIPTIVGTTFDVDTKSSADHSLSTQNLASALNQLPPFTEFRVLHMDPLVLAVDNFFTDAECDRYVEMSSKRTTLQSQSPTVGKDSSSRSQRTSTTWYHYYNKAPELMAKATKLLGLPSIHQWEEPQTVRYRRTEKFTWHLDALGPGENRPDKGGQRIATLLVYLTDMEPGEGGSTMFRDLKSPEGERLAVIPIKRSALLFFPAAGGIDNVPFDIRALHCGQAVGARAKNDKWIAQLWLCENDYTPTAPDPKNLHAHALEAIADYCKTYNPAIK